jgi:hypothetical protein
MPDYDKMINKTHPFQSWNIQYSMNLLEKKIKGNNINCDIEKSNQNCSDSDNYVANLYPRIFKSANGFKLFEYLKNNIVRDRYQLADYSFIFRHMQKDDYIYSISEKEFREFLFDNFEILLDKLKPEGYCETESKNSCYFTARNLFQSK